MSFLFRFSFFVFRFCMALENGICFSFSYRALKNGLNFLFRFCMALENGIRILFSYVFGKRISISNFNFQFSFFVFVWHWKTEFVFCFPVLLEKGFEFHFSFVVFVHLESLPVSSRRLGNHLCFNGNDKQ